MQKTIEKENYLKAICRMDEKNQKITVTSLAQHFNVSKSTVSNMIKKLIAMNLVNSKPYKPIVLTKFGRKNLREILDFVDKVEDKYELYLEFENPIFMRNGMTKVKYPKNIEDEKK